MPESPEYIYSEKPAINLFKKMGYEYYDAGHTDERNGINEVILHDRLKQGIKQCNPWINENNIKKAINELLSRQGSSLMETNREKWELIRTSAYSVKQVIEGEEKHKPVYYINYREPEKNDFLVVRQMRYHGAYNISVPDLTVFINGIPVAVIECKAPGTNNASSKAISDLGYYQENSPKLFHFNQLCVGIYRDGGKYGAINASYEYYSHFRAEDNTKLTQLLVHKPTNQDELIYNLFRKESLPDLIRHFVIFEAEDNQIVKKIPRYQQIRATNKAIQELKEGEKGGVIWHTQGSGKSLTMAYITRKLQAEEYGFDNPTVLVMTDRKDLDRQIKTTFTNIGFKNLYPALSVLDLQKKLKNDYGGIITTTLQKFQEPNKAAEETTDQTEQEESENKKVEKYIQDGILTKITRIWDKEKQNWIETEKEEIELEKLSDKDNLYVLVDEAHRSHYGFLAALMRTVIPKAKFIAFTGTPISKEDKSTLAEFYGEDYIDVYTIKQSVADGATKDLLYDEGIARLDIKKEELDKKFEEEYSDLPEEKKEKLKKEALKRYQFSKERIKAISKHIIDHYKRKIYPDGHKAMVVCQGRYAAAKYKMIFEELKEEGYHNFKSKVIISLGNPKNDGVAKKVYERREYNKQHPNNPLPEYITPEEEIKESIEDFKLPFGDESVTEKSGAKKYNNVAFLIVSDMLLTGYDAPIASCLYLDKPLKEHNLLQAIARVNRAYNRHGNKKHAGYIVDYYGITEYLIQALEIFSGDVKKEDILKNLDEEIPRLETNHAKLIEFFKPIKTDRNYQREQFIDDAIRYLEPINLRDEFKDLLKQFNKSLDIVLPNEAAMRYEKDFKLFNEIKLRLKNIYPEDEDLKISADESKKLQRMIDEHVKATGVDNLLEEPVSIIDKENFKKDIMNASPETKELKIKNNLKHTIKVGLDRNPDFYKPLAERLEELIKKREENRISQLELFDAFDEMQNQIINEQKEGQRKGFYTEKEVAVYNSMKAIFGENAEQTTKEIFQQINGELSIVDWKNKGGVKKDMENKIMKKLKEKLNRNEARKKAGEIVQLIIKNA